MRNELDPLLMGNIAREFSVDGRALAGMSSEISHTLLPIPVSSFASKSLSNKVRKIVFGSVAAKRLRLQTRD